MGRPKADLASYSPWGAFPIPPPLPPNPLWLPVTPAAGLVAWSDLAMWALGLPGVSPMVSLYTNDYQPTNASVLTDFASPVASGLLPMPIGMAHRVNVNALGRAQWSWPNVVFTAAGAGLPVHVWGYYVYINDPITGLPGLLWAQRFPRSFGFLAAGNSLPIPLNSSWGAC